MAIADLKVPLKFDLTPYNRSWFAWKEVAACFWPGHGKRSIDTNPTLGKLVQLGGIYLFAHSEDEPRETPHPASFLVQYIGETNNFKTRMSGFGRSAGFWGQRENGHSAAWAWDKPQGETWVAFFVMGNDTGASEHVLTGLRKWTEALALDEYFQTHNKLPNLNTRPRINRIEH
jgi:hypothetical protein